MDQSCWFLLSNNDSITQDHAAFIEYQRKHGVAISPEVESELSSMQIYQREVGWRMFIPPLPVHQVSLSFLLGTMTEVAIPRSGDRLWLNDYVRLFVLFYIFIDLL